MPFYGFLKFLNIEFWYCVIYSWFGGRCTTTDVEGIPGTDISAAHSATTTASSIAGGFIGVLLAGAAALWHIFGPGISALWSVYSSIAYTVSGLLMLSILGSLGGLAFIRSGDIVRYGRLPAESKTAHHMRGRWAALLDGAMSASPKEWRESIIAADQMLGELLLNLGYAGAETAERLTNVPEGAFVTLPLAWEAHRVRNFIVSDASDFILTQREAFRVMKLYEQVFEEFGLV